MNEAIRFGDAQRSRMLSTQTIGERKCQSTLTTSRVRHAFVVLFLALLPVLGSAQVGRIFVSAEAYAGLARVVHVGKIIELKQIEYGKPLTDTQKAGKSYRLVFEVSETIRGNEVNRLELVLSLQTTIYLEYMREHSVEIMLVGGPSRLDSFAAAELGIEEQGKRAVGEWYQFRVLDPVKVPDSGTEASIASQINIYYDSCRMFTNELGIVTGRNAILERVRAFARQHTKVLAAVTLLVPNEFGALCGDPNAYCGIMFPICPEIERTLVALKHDPGIIFRRIKSRNQDFSVSWLVSETDKALSMFPEEGGIRCNAEQPGAAQPATQPVDKAPVKDAPR